MTRNARWLNGRFSNWSSEQPTTLPEAYRLVFVTRVIEG